MPDSQHTINVLNHLLAIHNRSLPVYMASAQPWLGRNGTHALAVLEDIANAHLAMVDRVGELIIELEGVVRQGEFPMKFSGWHDLAVEFMIDRCIECQKLDIERIEKCVGWLGDSPRARVLAEEALGEAKAHLEALEELQQPQAAS